MEQIVPFTDGNWEENCDLKLSIWKQIIPFLNGSSEQNSRKLTIMELIVSFTEENSEQNSTNYETNWSIHRTEKRVSKKR